MAGALAYDKEVEKKVFRLLADYKQISSFNEALEEFKENYNLLYRDEIFEKTTSNTSLQVNQGYGVSSLEEAIFLLDESNFIKNKTTYKQIGLVFGIDPEYFTDFRLEPEYRSWVGDEIKGSWKDPGTYNFTYDNRNLFGKQQLYYRLDNQSAFRENLFDSQSSLDRSALGYVQNNTIFITPGVIQYFVNLAVYRSRDLPEAGIEILNFVENEIITNILFPFIELTFVGPDVEKQRIDELLSRDILKIRDLKTNISNGSIPNIEEYQNAFNHNYTYIKSTSERLPLILEQIINGGAFGTNFGALDTEINSFYDANHDKLVSYGFRPGSDNADTILKNKQLQDILAFFGLAEPRQDADTPEASITTLADLPEALLDREIEPPKLTPFDFQCFLLENISKLVDQRENGSFAADYKNIVRVSNDGDPGNIINTIEGVSRSRYIKHFLDICPEVYGLLVPYLKISRLEYDDVGNIKTKKVGNRDVAVEKDLKIPNFLTQDDIQNILDGAVGRAPGAGIKSFSWSLDGVQPAEVDNNISATLVMYFQSVNDFFNGARRAGQDEPNFLDLIINSPAVKKLQDKDSDDIEPDEKPCTDDLLKNKLHEDYEGHNFRVKICAGWSTPPLEALQQLTKDDKKAKALEEAFDNSRISLFLQMTQHQISFNQNGTLELSVSYQASLAGLLTGKTADIFDVSSKSIKQDIKNEKQKIKNVQDDDTISDDSKKEIKKDALEEIKKLKNIDRNVKYKKLLKRIFSAPRSCGSGVPIGQSKIYNISLSPDELTVTPYKDLNTEQRQARVKRRETTETFEFQSLFEVNNVIRDSINDNLEGSGADVATAASNTAVKTFNQFVNKDKINIPFFYLGDLIDTVIEEIKFNNQKTAAEGTKPLNFHMFLSDVEMIDPLQAFKVNNLEDLINCGYNLKEINLIDASSKRNPTDDAQLNGIYRTMNIGDIPISVDAFQLWFKDNVVKKERNTYFLLYFIKDICNGLITKALSSKCFGKEFNFQQRFDAQPLTLGKEETKISSFIPGDGPYSVRDVGHARARVTCALDPIQTELGLLLYSTDSRPKRLLGEKSFESDTERGIYHHYLGASCGLVKSINFQREDQAYLRESRIQKEGALGAEQLRELYSANIDLIGNTLYKNGMYIYINPSLLGASQEYLDYLGLHGYYLVTSVKSTITPSSFDVSIRALHEGIEFKDNKLLPTGYINRSLEGVPVELDPTRRRRRRYEEPVRDEVNVSEAVKNQDVVIGGSRPGGGIEISRGANLEKIGGIPAGTKVDATGRLLRK